MFCGCSPSFGDEPNTHTCPVCLGHPGSLPTTNEQSIRYALMIAAALECEVPPRSIFHRKQYFYPDQAKNYQISQYDEPLAVNGRLGDVRIERAHLEEDTAKMIHVGRVGADPRLGRLPGRLQPSGHAAGRDRHRARSALSPSGPRVGAAAPHHGPPARRLRREHGGGLAPGGRQRLDPARRLRRARHQDRAQEHEQLPVPRARDRGRAGPPARPARERGGGRPGHAPLPPRGRLAHAAALEGVRARLPLLPRARPRARGAHRGDAEGGARFASRAAGTPARALPERGRPLRGVRDHARLPARVRRVLRARRR